MVFYKKKGFPKEKDIVLCKVKKILPHSVFAELLEYENKEGMIHISEISSRWTKNINEVVNIGKIIVCRVEKVDEQKGFIDLSKKRVTSGEEKNKKNEEKNENRIEKLIEYSCKKHKITIEDFYKKSGFKIVEEYGSLYNFYENYIEQPSVLNELTLSKECINDIKASFESLVQNSRVVVKKNIKFFAKGANGINDLKEFIKKITESIKDKDSTLKITYINSPEYLVSIDSVDYKTANSIFEKIMSKMKELSKKFNISVLE